MKKLIDLEITREELLENQHADCEVDSTTSCTQGRLWPNNVGWALMIRVLQLGMNSYIVCKAHKTRGVWGHTPRKILQFRHLEIASGAFLSIK